MKTNWKQKISTKFGASLRSRALWKCSCSLACWGVIGVFSASGQQITWNADSLSNFNLTFSGSGNPSASIVSPSGLWRLACDFSLSESDSRIYISQGESAVWFGTQSSSTGLIFPGYADILADNIPITDGTVSDQNISLGGEGWYGSLDITITSQPVLSDTSTWTWTIDSFGSGPALIDPLPAVPEPNLGIWLMVFALIWYILKCRPYCSELK